MLMLDVAYSFLSMLANVLFCRAHEAGCHFSLRFLFVVVAPHMSGELRRELGVKLG